MRSIDQFVGHRIQARRGHLGLTVKAVADMLGTQYQQVQRYESGAIRVPASRLWGFAKVLGVRVDYFFEGYKELPENTNAGAGDTSGHSADIELDAISLQLLRGFAMLDEDKREAIVLLVKSLVRGGPTNLNS